MIIMNALHLIVTILISFRQKHNVLIEIALGMHDHQHGFCWRAQRPDVIEQGLFIALEAS